MRHVVLAFAILGAILPGVIAVNWLRLQASDTAVLADLNAMQDNMLQLNMGSRMEMQKFQDTINEVELMHYNRGRAIPFLLVGVLFAVAAAVLAEFRQGVSAGVLLLAAYIGPGIIYPVTFCFGFLLVPPAIMAFFVRARRDDRAAGSERRGGLSRRPERDDEEEDERPRRRSPRDDDEEDRPGRRSRRDDEEDDRPSRRRRPERDE
jgi:hypothetical protein